MLKPIFDKPNRKKTFIVIGALVLILIIVIIVIATRPGPAAFMVSDLTIKPQQAQPGQAISIGAAVINNGGSAGSYTAELKINDVISQTRTIPLAVNEKQPIAFTISENVAGTYTVAIGNLTGQFTVIAPEPEIRTWVVTDADAVRLVSQKMPGQFTVHFTANNTIKYAAFGDSGNVTISIVDGKLSTTPADPLIYNMLPGIHQWVKLENFTVYLVGLWFDPTVEIAPDVTSIPYMASITTEDGQAIITYKWPS